jgi:hypothetical protein
VIGQAAVDTCLDTLRDPNSRRVLPPTAAACDTPITPEEVESVINDLPTGKSSGPDRIPNKMYRVLTKDLTEIITNVLNESQREGALPDSCLQGIISTMHKKQARDDPRNYRPITLLNGDYKIFTRALTRRMNKAVLQFVSPQQNGFVPGGFLPENIMLLKLIQAYISRFFLISGRCMADILKEPVAVNVADVIVLLRLLSAARAGTPTTTWTWATSSPQLLSPDWTD